MEPYWQFTFTSFLFLLASCFSIGLAFYASRLRLSKIFLGVFISLALWAGGDFLMTLRPVLRWQMIFFNLKFFGVMSLTWLWPFFCSEFSRQTKWISVKNALLFAVIPVVCFLLLLTTSYHGLFYSSFELIDLNGIILLDNTAGSAFYLWLAYVYSVFLATTILLLRAVWRYPKFFKQQAFAFVLATLLPILPNLLVVSPFNPFKPYDITSLFFALTALVIFISMHRSSIFQVIPIAHSEVVKHVNVGIVAIDNQGHILDFNPAAETMLNAKANDVVGKEILEAFPEHSQQIKAFSREDCVRTEIELNDSVYELQIDTIYKKEKPTGRIIMFYDISSLVRAKRELLGQLSETKKLQVQLEDQASRDPLTNLYNRRFFHDMVPNMLSECQRYGDEFSIILFDLDHFKKINDNYGHAAGDMVLLDVARAVSRTLRDVDIFARYGGEEFIIALPKASLKEAETIAERLRTKIADLNISYETLRLSVRASFGVASSVNYSFTELINQADKASYEAKKQGRNQVVVFDPELETFSGIPVSKSA